MSSLLPSCYDSDSSDCGQESELDHNSREDLSLCPGRAPSGAPLQVDQAGVRPCTDLCGFSTFQEQKQAAPRLQPRAENKAASTHRVPATSDQDAAGPNSTARGAAQQGNQPTYVLTGLKADSPTSSTHKPILASATGVDPHAATSLLRDTHPNSAPVPALPGDQLPALDLSQAAVQASHTDTTPRKVSASAASPADHAIEPASTDAPPTSAQLPMAPQTHPHTDRLRPTAPATVSPTALVGPQADSAYLRAAQEHTLAAETPASPELSSQADVTVAPAPAGPDVRSTLPPGKAPTREDGAALLAGLAISPPHPTGQAPAQASSSDAQVATTAPVLGTQPAAACSAVATDDSAPAAPTKVSGADAVDRPGTTGAVTTDAVTTDAVTTDAVTAGAVTTDTKYLPVAERATEAAAGETAEPAAASKSALLTAGESCPSIAPSAPASLPQQVGPPNDLAALSLQDSGGVPPPPPTGFPLIQVAPRNLPAHPDVGAPVLSLPALPSAQSPVQWWNLCQTACLATGLARQPATAQAPAPSPHQPGVQVRPSEEAFRQQPAAAASATKAEGQDEVPMEIAVSKQAAEPSSHETPDPSANSLDVSTAGQLAVPAMDGAAVDHIPDPTTDPPNSRVCTPPSTNSMESHGLPAMNTNPSITAVRAASREEEQLPTGKQSGHQPTAGASASAVAATAGASAPAGAAAVAPTVKPQSKRVTRCRQHAAAKETAAPAVSLTTTTSPGKARGLDLVGQRIEVWWSGEDKFLPGVVTAFSPSKGHRVEYDDGDSLNENLTYRTHRLPHLAGNKVFNPEADAESLMPTYSGPNIGTATGVSSDVKPGGNKAGTKSDVRSGTKPNTKFGAKADVKPGAKAGLKTGMALKGQRIEVWWAKDARFYPGIVTSYKKGKHRVVYDDRDVGFEDLQHKKHKLPDLAGDQVFNPDADAVSSSDSEDKPLADLSGSQDKSTLAAAPSSGQALEALPAAAAATAPLAAHAGAKTKGPCRTRGGDDGIPMNAAQAGMPANTAAPVRSSAKGFRTPASLTASISSDRLPQSFAPSTWPQPQIGATPNSLELPPHTGGATSSANGRADAPGHHPNPPAGQFPISLAPANADLDRAAGLSQVQPGSVLVPSQQRVLLPAGSTTLWSQLHPHTASSPQPVQHPHPHPQATPHSSLVNNLQHASEPTSTLITAQLASTLHPLPHHPGSSPLNPQLLQQPHMAGPYAIEDCQHQRHPQTASAAAAAAAAPAAAPAAAAATGFPSFLPQLPSRGQLSAHPATAPAWAADHLQVLPPAQPRTQLDPQDVSGTPSGSHAAPNLPVQAAQHGMHPSVKDAALQPLQLVSNPQAVPPQPTAGLPPSGVQRPPLVPTPAPCYMQSRGAKLSPKPQETAALQLAVQTEDIPQGVTALHMTGATPVTAPKATAPASQATAAAPQATAAAPQATSAAPQATAAPQAPTAAAQRHTTTAQPPTTVAEVSTAGVPRATTAAVCATAHHATDAAKAQSAPQLPSQQDGSPETAPATAPAPAASVPPSIPPDQARLPATTTQKSSKSKKGAAHAGPKQKRSSHTAGGARTAGQTQLAAQASDSPASGSLQGYLAHASPGSISRLKQELRRPPASARQAAVNTPPATPVSSPVFLGDPHSPAIPGQPVRESLLLASDTHISAANKVAAQPASVDTSQLQAVSAHTGAAAATQVAAGEAVDAAAAATQEAGDEAKDIAALEQRPQPDLTAQRTQDQMIADTLQQWEATRRDLFAYAARVPDPVVKQKLTDVLAGSKPVSPMLSYKSDSDSRSDSDSSSDSDAEPDQDTAGAVLPVLADVHHRGEAPPVRQSSNMPSKPSPLHPAADAQAHRQAQLAPHSPPSSGLHPAQPSPKRPVAMRSVGQLHSILPSSQHQHTRPDQASPRHMLNQALRLGRKLTTRTQSNLPNAPVLPTLPAMPDQATVLTPSSEQPASRKRGASSSEAHLASLAPGAAANGVSKKQKPASGPESAGQGDRATAGHGALAGSSSSQVPAVNRPSTALVIHPSAVQPGRQTCAARAAAHGPGGDALALVPNRHAAVLREQAEVAEHLPNLLTDAEDYKIFRCHDPPGFEVYCMMGGMDRDDIRVTCSDNGSIQISADPKPVPRYMWAVKPINIQLQVPGCIKAESTIAFLTLHGQLWLRVESVP